MTHRQGRVQGWESTNPDGWLLSQFVWDMITPSILKSKWIFFEQLKAQAQPLPPKLHPSANAETDHNSATTPTEIQDGCLRLGRGCSIKVSVEYQIEKKIN
jgi:hypothetical protein